MTESDLPSECLDDDPPQHCYDLEPPPGQQEEVVTEGEASSITYLPETGAPVLVLLPIIIAMFILGFRLRRPS